MPVLVNNESGLAEDLPQDQADQALSSGTHALPLNDPQGNPVTAPLDQAKDLISQGHTQPSPEQLQNLLKYAKYSSPVEQGKAALETAAKYGTFGLSTGVERALGVDPEDIRNREDVFKEESPWLHGASEIAGLFGSPIGEAKMLGEAGKAVSEGLNLGGEGAGFLSNIGAHAAQLGTESALMQAGDENSKLLSSDPNQSVETALTNIGLSGLVGSAGGAALGSVSPLWQAAKETKVGQFLEDFKSRVDERMKNPDAVGTVKDQLSNYYNTIKDMADEVYGAKGLKSQDVQKLMPEQMTDKISGQANSIIEKTKNTISEMEKKPNVYPERLVDKIRGDLENLQSGIGEAQSPGQVFDSIEKFKQKTQGYSKFEKFIKPVDDSYDFVQKAKGLAFDTRQALEDSDVWGKAADRQKAINKAFVEFKPTLEDFESKFTTEVNGDRVIDPGKVNTYMNQLGKANAEIKQQMLENFIKASEKYKGVIDETHSNLGIQSPFQPASINAAKATLDKITPGAKVADALINKGLARIAGEGLGAGIGGGVGHAFGSGWLGAIIGEHALGPVFSSVLPAIVKPILEKPASAAAFKSAIDLGVATVKGESLISKAAKAVFKSGADVLPTHLIPTEAKREKIKSKLDDIQTDQAKLLNIGGGVGHYMPDHGAALAQTATRATQYLSSLKPNTAKLGPLDPPREPSQVEKSAYDRALDLVEQPLLAMQSIKDGTLTPQDVITFKTVYPSLYDRVSQKLTSEMIDHVSKDETVPYSSRLSLSLFLGQPLDATMTPQAIMATQPKPPAPSPQQASEPKQHGSMKALNKMSGMYQTPSQSREMEKISRSGGA